MIQLICNWLFFIINALQRIFYLIILKWNMMTEFAETFDKCHSLSLKELTSNFRKYINAK